jgi:hypothetical protein
MYTNSSSLTFLATPFPAPSPHPPHSQKKFADYNWLFGKSRWLCEGSSVVTWYKEGQVLSADSFLVLQVSRPTGESSDRWVVQQVSRPTGESSCRWVVLQVSLPTGESSFRWVVLQVSRPTGESSYRWVVLQVSRPCLIRLKIQCCYITVHSLKAASQNNA